MANANSIKENNDSNSSSKKKRNDNNNNNDRWMRNSSMEPSIEVELPYSLVVSSSTKTVLELLQNFLMEEDDESAADRDSKEEQWKIWAEELERLDGIYKAHDLCQLIDEEFEERSSQWDDELATILTRYRNLWKHSSNDQQYSKPWWYHSNTTTNTNSEPLTQQEEEEEEEDVGTRNATNEQIFRNGQYFMLQPCSLVGYVLQSPIQCGLSPTLIPQSQANNNNNSGQCIWKYQPGKHNIICRGTKLVLDMVRDSDDHVVPGATVTTWTENLQDNQRWDYHNGQLVYNKSLRLNKKDNQQPILVLDVYLEQQQTIHETTTTTDHYPYDYHSPKHLLRMWPEDGSMAQQWKLIPVSPPSTGGFRSAILSSIGPNNNTTGIVSSSSQRPSSLLYNSSSVIQQHSKKRTGSGISRQLLLAQASSSLSLFPKSMNLSTMKDEIIMTKTKLSNSHRNRRIQHGFYLESLVNPGWCLQMSHACQGAIAHLVPKETYSSNAQKWKYYPNHGGILTNVSFDIHSKDNLVLDITRGSDEPGMTICMWPRNGKSHQSWRLIPCSDNDKDNTPNNNNNNNNHHDEMIVIIQTQHSSRHVVQAEKMGSNHDYESTKVFMWPSTNEDSQKWRIVYP